jgi:osomolarity two-component system sensor histidine kinase SLN1
LQVFNEIIQFDANKLQGGKGSGLGLYITRGIVELHKGQVAVKSKGIGYGCVFTVMLPLFKNPDAEPARPYSQGSVSSDQAVAQAQRPGKVSSMLSRLASNNANNKVTPLSSPYSRLGGPFRRVGSNDSGLDVEMGRFNPMSGNVSMSSVASGGGPARSFSRLVSGGILNASNNIMFSGSLSTVTASNSQHATDSTNDLLALQSHRGAGILGFDEDNYERSRNSMIPSFASDSTASVNVALQRAQPQQQHQGLTRSNTQNSTHNGGAFQCDLSGLRVLLVDDSPINLKMVGIVMKKLGAVCETAADGGQALERIMQSVQSLRNHTTMIHESENENESSKDESHNANFALDNGSMIHMVIMDNFMPVMNGPEACRLMRKAGFEFPIFGLTGDCQEEDIQVFLDAGATFIFQKPFNITSFSSVIGQILDLPEYQGLVNKARASFKNSINIDASIQLATNNRNAANGSTNSDPSNNDNTSRGRLFVST